jgi:hypothetical protein
VKMMVNKTNIRHNCNQNVITEGEIITNKETLLTTENGDHCSQRTSQHGAPTTVVHSAVLLPRFSFLLLYAVCTAHSSSHLHPFTVSLSFECAPHVDIERVNIFNNNVIEV